MTLDYNILAPTIASLLFAALFLLFVWLMPVDWSWLKKIKPATFERAFAEAWRVYKNSLSRFVKYVRVMLEQSLTAEDRRFWRNVLRMAYVYVLVLAGLAK